MSLSLSFQLRVEERGDDRVVVSVLLAPSDGSAVLEGIALQLQSRTGEALGARMLLPIAGRLAQPMMSTVELKSDAPIPLGSRVVGTVWQGLEQREASIPTDPFTELEVHMRARRRILPRGAETEELERLIPEDRKRIAKDFPWIDEPRIPPKAAGELTVLDQETPLEASLDEIAEDLGLDADVSEWLKDLLQEDDPRPA